MSRFFYFTIVPLAAATCALQANQQPPMVYSFHLEPCDPEESEACQEAAQRSHWYRHHYEIQDPYDREETPHNMLEDDTSWPGKREDFSDYLNRDFGPLYNN